jgi:hypothetical protein
VPSVAVFVIAAVLIGATIWVEARAAEPIMPGWLWRVRPLAGANLAMIGMGFVLMGPNAYLPTFAQSVLGLGAIASGLVLAAMSIGWPTASALAGGLYLRIGFRATALAGSVLICAAGAGFLALPYTAPVWAVVGDQIALGAGFGLLSTSLLVGVQTLVGWQGRGVVTGANMFSRYLGQSLGAAVFGAIFNATLTARLAAAPGPLRARLPHDVNAVMGALHGERLSAAAKTYLRHAIYAATHHLYYGLLAVALLTLIVVLLIPRGFTAAPAAGESHRGSKASDEG